MKLTAIALTALMITGCGNFNAINKRFSPNNNQSISIDAKQRVVYSIEKKFKGSKWTAICAEPSPDALSALSASAGANAEVIEKALTISTSSNETAASIGLRTQTIQILRDAMYRSCEAYASGAMDNVDFKQAQRRYQDVMLALLAIEQLTGVVTAQQVALGGSSESIATRGLDSIQEWIEKTRAELTAKTEELPAIESEVKTKKAELDTAQASYDKLVAEAGTDAEKLQQAEKFKNETLAASIQAHTKETNRLSLAKAEQETLQKSLDELIDAQKSVGSAAAKQVSTINFQKAVTPNSAFNEKTAKIIADSVVEIVKVTSDQDYLDEWCFDVVRDPAHTNKKIAAQCVDHLKGVSAARLANAQPAR